MPGPDNTTGGYGFISDPRTLAIAVGIVSFIAGAAIVYFAMR